MSETIGFIGVGSQGGPTAHRVGDAGMSLVVWPTRAEVLDAISARFLAAANPGV